MKILSPSPFINVYSLKKGLKKKKKETCSLIISSALAYPFSLTSFNTLKIVTVSIY